MVQMFAVQLVEDIHANWQHCSLHKSLSRARKCKGHVARMRTDVASFSPRCRLVHINFQCQKMQTKIVSVCLSIRTILKVCLSLRNFVGVVISVFCLHFCPHFCLHDIALLLCLLRFWLFDIPILDFNFTLATHATTCLVLALA